MYGLMDSNRPEVKECGERPAEETKKMVRWFRSAALVLVIVLLVGYLADAAVLQMRVRHGTGYRVIQVDQFLNTPLKGQKEEYDLAGQTQVTCARSLFPQLGYQPCWWVERHREQWN